MSLPISPPRRSRPQLLQALLIVLAGFWAFSPAFHGDWLWDDNLYIIANPLMDDPAGLWKTWFQPGILIDYYPITFTVQHIEWALWGMDTLGYHLTNVVLHLLSALLVWRLFDQLGLRLAWWGALIFAIHPVMVESVSWITELKNTLSLPPLLGAMCLWIDYDEKKRGRDYILALLLFLVAMLCKTSGTMLPTVFLLYAWWKRGRIGWTDLKVSAPFFLISLLLGIAGIWLEHHHPGPPPFVTPDWLSRVDTSQRQIFFFLLLCFFPLHLLPIYPSGLVAAPSFLDLLPWIPLLGFLYLCWINRRAWGRHALLGLGFFLLNLVPILIFILASLSTMIWSMDHLVYLPIIGLIGLVVSGLDALDRRLSPPARLCVNGVAVVITVLLALECHIYAGIFGDAEALWSHAVRGNPDSWMVRTNLGEALGQRNRVQDAVGQFKAAIRMNPIYDNAHYDLAKALGQLGRTSEAIQEYGTLLKINPGYANAYYDLGNLLLQSNRIPEATEQFNLALRVNPQHAPTHYALGNLFLNANKIPEAIDQYEQSLQIAPKHPEVHSALGKALLRVNRLPEALDQCLQAVALDSNDVSSLSNAGVALARMGRFPEASQQFQAVLQIDPNYFEARNNLGSIFLVTGRFPEAVEQYQAALRIKPDSADVKKNLARALQMEKARAATPPSP